MESINADHDHADHGKNERTGISRYAEVNKVKNAIDISFGGKSYAKTNRLARSAPPDYNVGDKVRQIKYGVGTVLAINEIGDDYEVAVDFESVGVKKLMAHLSNLKKR